jgi:hypothetical protein
VERKGSGMTVRILKSTNVDGLKYFIATLDDGRVRYGIVTRGKVGGLIQSSSRPEIIAKALEIAKIEDDNEFEEAIDELFY